MGNLFGDVQPPEVGEDFSELLRHNNVRIERIVSGANVTPTSYVQEHDEWVVLLEGCAEVDMAGEKVELKRGDTLFLPAHVPHMVMRVSNGAIWLAVHIDRADP